MPNAFICDGIRTPIGRYGGALSQVRTDDLAAIPLKALREKFAKSDWESVEEVFFGCANQAGEDNRNVARMALLLAGIPCSVPGATVNRLCGSGMEAVSMAARAIVAGEISLAIAHEPRAVRDSQSSVCFFAKPRNLRHHNRLAFYKSADGENVRDRVHAGNGRKRGGKI
jgi:acetyl-CoA acetyltransferase